MTPTPFLRQSPSTDLNQCLLATIIILGPVIVSSPLYFVYKVIQSLLRRSENGTATRPSIIGCVGLIVVPVVVVIVVMSGAFAFFGFNALRFENYAQTANSYIQAQHQYINTETTESSPVSRLLGNLFLNLTTGIPLSG